MIGIYIIKNDINDKVYIGQSINIEKRIKEHFWKAQNSNDVSYNVAIHQAIRKYGKEHFSWEILQECSEEELDTLEQEYIKKFNSLSPNGYNILEGGQKIRSIANKCKICGKPILKGSNYCILCSHILQRRCQRPTREELKQMIRTESFVDIAKKYGVTDNAIKKWCASEGLPNKRKIIKTYTDEEWSKI